MVMRRLFLSLLALGVLAATGLISKFVPATQAEKADAGPAIGQRMVQAAQNLVAGLSQANRDKSVFPFGDPTRTNWHYYPILPEPRKGAMLKEMTAPEKELLKALLRTGTSPAGYQTTLNLMALEGILRDIENTEWAKLIRDPERYHVCIFGKPDVRGKWGWRIEGHHLSLNYTLEDGKIIARTPIAFGANPGEVMSGPHKGMRLLAPDEDVARKLLTALDAEGRRKAILKVPAPFDVLTEVLAQPRKLPLEGLSFAEMSPHAQELLQQVMGIHANRQPKEVAEQLLQEVQEGGMDKVHFAWAGSPLPGQPHYYRIQGPTFVIEFCNAQNRANHSHTVWRSYKGDF